eukprot:2704826-Prymnesium_polylepis.1
MNSAISTALSSYSNTTAMSTAITTAIVGQTNTHAFFYPHAYAPPNHSTIQVGDFLHYTGGHADPSPLYFTWGQPAFDASKITSG